MSTAAAESLRRERPPAEVGADPAPATGPLPRLGNAALPFLLVLGLVALTPSSAVAQGDDDTTAMALLRRAVVAASSVSYRAVQVDATWTSTGMTTRTIDVRQHGGLRSMTVRASGTTAGRTTTEPVRSVAGPADPLALIAAAYAVSSAGKDEIAGRKASVVVALREGRVAARLWLDDACGLLLRQEVWDAHGRLTRMTGLVELEEPTTDGVLRSASTDPVGGPTAGGSGRATVAQDADLLASVQGGSGAAAGDLVGTPGAPGGPSRGSAPEDPRAVARRLHSPCPDQLPGGFRLVDAREVVVSGAGGPASRAVHLTYSDGLSAMSIFVQSGRLPVAGPSGTTAQVWDGARVYVAVGWPFRAVWQGEGQVFTVISDAPVDQVSAAVRGLPGAKASSGVLQRVGTFVSAARLLLPGH